MLYSVILSGGAALSACRFGMHKTNKKSPFMIVICAVVLFSIIAMLPIYCNRDNEADHLALEAVEAAELNRARDEAAVVDLVDTDIIADKEGYSDPEEDPAFTEEPDAGDSADAGENADSDGGEEVLFEPDRSKLPIYYPKTTPRPAPSMIHSTAHGVLETHGDFEGMEDALDRLNGYLTRFSGKISVVAYTLDGSRSLTYNSDYGYMSQCTIKASFIYAICQYMDATAFDDSTIIIYNPSDFVEGSGSVKFNSFGTGFTVRDLVIRTLKISDNTAYNMLLRYFGNDLRNECMRVIGADSLQTYWRWGDNVRPEDYIVLWDEIYNYLRTDSYYAKLMREACTNTPYAYAKPTNGLDYSHKSGDGPEWGDCHDVVLVWDDVPYILAVFTNASYTGGSHPTIENVSWVIHELLF